MHERFRKKIRQNFVELVLNVEPEVFANYLLRKNALEKDEVDKIFEEKSDYKHNNRLLIFTILKKSDTVYHHFVEGLELFGLKHLFKAPGGTPGHHHTTLFREADTHEEGLSNSQNNNIRNPDNDTTEPVQSVFPSDKKLLTVQVKLAEEIGKSVGDDIYTTQSINRGHVLIINNRYFNNHRDHPERRGSEIDLKCLDDLFKQMGMKVEIHEDLLKTQMEDVILQFRKYSHDKISDICVVVIMSHGEERGKEQVVLDKYGNGLKTSWIEDQFNNINCPLYSEKPKVFLYQVCRGSQYDYATTKVKFEGNGNEKTPRLIETDIIQNVQEAEVEFDSGRISQIERPTEDMLIAYPTQRGCRAHREPFRGSWFIQLICEVFMERAHNTGLIKMLNEVDRRLKLYSSREYTIQTSSYTSKGFNKDLFFNPGIYLDSIGNVQKFK